jgi:tRNA A37 threonylcarbamoyladenosine dehydratase
MKRLAKHIYDEMIKELWSIRNPHIKFDERLYKKFRLSLAINAKSQRPITNLLPSQKAFFELSTARNRNLINIEEQNRLRETVVAFFGLSVGSHAALTWMMESRADALKIIDPDFLSATNLNRVRYGWSDVGRSKVSLVKEQVSEINPFSKITVYRKGNVQEIRDVFEKGSSVHAIVDEIDDFEAKILIRKLAKEKRIPVLSAADVGDNIVLDIERYDLDPNQKLFLGRVSDIEQIKFSELNEKEKKKLVIQLVGFEENSERMLDSLFSIGGSIVTWPQLGATATIAGGVIATSLKKIILGEEVVSGRYYISLDELLVKDFNRMKRKNLRTKRVKQIKQLLEKK